MGGKILLRLAELAAFENLSHVPHVPPQRCHKLEDSKLKFAVDVSQNYRLIFFPAPPYEYTEGVGLIKESVKAILIEEVTDYH